MLGTRQDDSRLPSRPVPARLAVLVLQREALPFAEALAVGADLLVDEDGLELGKVAHPRVAVALLGLLARVLVPAELVRVLPAVLGNALVLEGAEDVVRAVVLCQVGFLLPELGLLVRDFRDEILVGGARVADCFALAA